MDRASTQRSAPTLRDTLSSARRGDFDAAALSEGKRYRLRRVRMTLRALLRAETPAATARVVAIVERPGTRVVVVECPFAAMHSYQGRGHQFHVHGWPYGQSDPGHRVPHCDNDPGGLYRLAAPSSADGSTADPRPQTAGDALLRKAAAARGRQTQAVEPPWVPRVTELPPEPPLLPDLEYRDVVCDSTKQRRAGDHP